MKTKANLIAAILMIGLATLHAQVVTIDSLDANGRLTATVPSNAVYTVEWAGSLTSSNGWQKGWSQLRDVKSADGTVDTEVPMFYRLSCWTNGLFLNAPVGRTFLYAVSNQVDETWNRNAHVMADAYIPHQTNNYRTIWIEDWYSAPSLIPVGAQSRRATFMRVDEDSAYVLDSEFAPGPMQEDLVWKNGLVGTTWSYSSSTPHTTIDSEIKAIEDVVIGTTTYENCLKIESTGVYQDWLADYPDRRYIEWIQPNGYLVKSMNWWVGTAYTNATPIVSELQGWTDE